MTLDIISLLLFLINVVISIKNKNLSASLGWGAAVIIMLRLILKTIAV